MLCGYGDFDIYEIGAVDENYLNAWFYACRLIFLAHMIQ